MFTRIKRALFRKRRKRRERVEDDLGLPAMDRIDKWGYRYYVGGTDPETWYGIGKHQYHYLVSQGLRPEHVFLDIACGSLRLGQFLIPYLDKGSYYGLEGEKSLIDEGLRNELMFDIAAMKEPVFAVNYEFDFSFIDRFDFAVAQSLFTHLVLSDIDLCFRNLRGKAHRESVFYFTFLEGDSDKNPSTGSHANRNWHYSVDELRNVTDNTGWKLEYIGDWRHPRNQKLAVARI